MKATVHAQVFWILPVLISCSVIEFFESNYLDDRYSRTVQCPPNSNVQVNDYAKIVVIVCNGTEANTSGLLSCTGLSRIAGIAFLDCNLPSPDLGSIVREFKLQAIAFLHFRYPSLQEEVVVTDLDYLELIGLSITNFTKYKLQNLQNLRQIDMPFPDIDSFPPNLLSNFSLLNKVYLANGRIGCISENSFRGSMRLRVINLRNNTLKELPAGLFNGLQLLQKLELSYNLLESLPADIFSDLEALEEIVLNGNLFSQLPPILFRNQRNLLSLDISDNRKLTILPEDLFKNARKLREFFAANCSLTAIPEKLFSDAPSLSVLYFLNNDISSLSVRVFENNSLLDRLDLSGNLLRSLPNGIFSKNYGIKDLQLNSNLFERIPIGALLNVRNLQRISLRDNTITNADEAQLETIGFLEVLDLGNNNISSFNTPTPFGKLPYLHRLDLSNNSFISFPKLDWTAYAVDELLLNDNKISNLDIDSLPPGNTTIDLRFNEIKGISVPTQNSNLDGAWYIRLSSNPFLCDCRFCDFLQFLRDGSSESGYSILVPDADMLICDSPSTWKGQNIMRISPLYLLCPISRLCPKSCHCYQLRNAMVLVNCSSLGMTDLPRVIPLNTSIVHLEYNLIKEFTEVNPEYWGTVTRLYLDYNQMVTPQHWPALSIKYLSLRNNRLVKLPTGLMEYVANSSQFLLDIRNNSWICNCTYLHFKLWLTENIDKLALPEEILCTRKVSVNHSTILYAILNVPIDAFCPSGISTVAVGVIIGVFATCCTLLAAVILNILHFGSRRTFLAYIYVHFPSLFCFDVSDIEKDKAYDAFISYTGSDRDSVLTMLKELEDKPPYFKFCIHERDWLPGYPIVSQIESSVKNSRKTIIFLSPEFLDSFWCETEFQTAYMQSLEDKIDRLIVIVKGELPEKESMPLDLQTLLTTKTYLVWGERWFWEKIKYALPHFIRAERDRKQELVVEGMIQQYRDNKVI